MLWRAAPGCISCRRCAHILLGFLHEIAGPDVLLIFLPPQAQGKRDPLCGGGREKKGPHLKRTSVNRRGWPRLPRSAWFGAAALKQWRAVPLPWLTPALGATAPRMPSQEAPTPTLTSTRPDALFSLVQVAPWKPKTKRWRGCPSDQASVTPAPARPRWFLHENGFWFQKAAIFFRCASLKAS